MSVRHPTHHTILWQFDSRRWAQYLPRPDDIVIATYPKSGTTWMQRIVSLLVFQHTDPLPVMDISAWLDARFQPIEMVMAGIEAQAHRRFLKAHLAYDSLPIHDSVRYIHVARDGRDAALSYHGHLLRLKDEIIKRFDAIGRDDPALGCPFPRTPSDAAEYFHLWLTKSVVENATDGMPLPSYFQFEESWWNARHRDNVLMVHYSDLKADLSGQMRRIADHLEIDVPAALWPDLVKAAEFDSMKKEGATLLGRVGGVFNDGGANFIRHGTAGRWQGIFNDEDLALYDQKLGQLPPDCASWLRNGGPII